MRKKIFLVLSITIIAFLVFLNYSCSLAEKEKGKNDVYKQLDLFADVFSYIKRDYVEETENKDLIYGALQGMLGNLDAYSQFLDPDTYNELRVDTTGKFGGLGIEITIRDGLITVITPIEDTPAWKAGIKSLDRIVKIEDEVTPGFSLTDAVKKMRGKPGTDITITVLRESEGKLLDFTITRDIIKIKDIKEARILENGIAYIRLVEFREDSGDDLLKVLNDLTKEGMRALIMDLRNNPGGLLISAVDTAEKFIEKNKVIVSTQGRREDSQTEFKSKYGKPLLDLPMVVLINNGSASGSEIFAGAMQDYGRAIIMGTKSFGKASVQTLIPLLDGSAVKLTTSKYFTPNMRLIHDIGITPDITVKLNPIPAEKNSEKPDIDSEKVFNEIEDKEIEDKDEKYKKDNQIIAAIDVLKGILIYNKINDEK